MLHVALAMLWTDRRFTIGGFIRRALRVLRFDGCDREAAWAQWLSATERLRARWGAGIGLLAWVTDPIELRGR